LPTIEDIAMLYQTEKVLRESLRLYPSAWTLGRQALTDYTTIDNYVIPKGSIILMSQYVMHYNPQYYSNPERLTRIAGLRISNPVCLVLVTFRLVAAQEVVLMSLLPRLKASWFSLQFAVNGKCSTIEATSLS
jgi:hypothetical protein